MKRTAVVVTAAAMLVLVSCGGGGGSEDEDIAAPSATTAMSHGGPDASCSPSGTTVSVVASGTMFSTSCLAAPANQQFTISYDNRDSIAHNIVILESHTATSTLFRADIFAGPKTSTFNVGALRPGTYAFHCEVHPSVMQGTFVVK